MAFVTGSFTLDQSSWSGLQTLMTNLVNRVEIRFEDVGPPGGTTRTGEAVNIAWQIYESSSRYQFNFNTHESSQAVSNAFRIGFSEVRLNQGSANTVTALRDLSANVYSFNRGAREGNSDVALMFVRGADFAAELRLSGRLNAIRTEITNLNRRGIRVVFIADGSISTATMNQLVSGLDAAYFTDSSFLRMAQSSQTLDRIILSISQIDRTGNYN